jgi:hypothetical protein
MSPLTADSAALKIAELQARGFTQINGELPATALADLRREAFAVGSAGTRCLLDVPTVSATAQALKARLQLVGILPVDAVAIQAIAFDKTAGTNWKCTWHQDLMFPLARPATSPDYALSCVKADVPYSRPPNHVLAELLAARLHLDNCDSENGPLRIASATHTGGVIPSGKIEEVIATSSVATCLAEEGDVLLMRPLALHASSPAQQPRHRRVLHVVFHSGVPVAEPWHRTL